MATAETTVRRSTRTRTGSPSWASCSATAVRLTEIRPDCARSVLDSVNLESPDGQPGEDGCGEDSTWKVGSKPAGVSPYGVLDQAGNVWEWVADWYNPTYYEQSQIQAPKGPETGTRRSMRGS